MSTDEIMDTNTLKSELERMLIGVEVKFDEQGNELENPAGDSDENTTLAEIYGNWNEKGFDSYYEPHNRFQKAFNERFNDEPFSIDVFAQHGEYFSKLGKKIKANQTGSVTADYSSYLMLPEGIKPAKQSDNPIAGNRFGYNIKSENPTAGQVINMVCEAYWILKTHIDKYLMAIKLPR